jgi:hypothetical protein
MSKRIAVVDGANIAHIEKSNQGDPRVSNILSVHSLLKEKGYEPIIIVDASLLYEIDDRTQLESLIDEKIVWQVPAETSADYFVIETAERLNGLVISNDRYQSYLDQYPWIDERRIPLMIIQGHVELYEPKLEQIREQEK